MDNILLVRIISISTLIMTLLVKLIGIPSQIRIVYVNKSDKNISSLHFGLAFFSYVLWTIHGILIMDYVIIIGQSIGILTSGILLILLHYYKKKQI